MRLSDAIALGRVLLKPKPWGGPSSDPDSGVGCALQMAFMAIGEADSAYRFRGPDISRAVKIFGKIADSAMSEFDHRAGVEGADFNMDSYLDWLRRVEPAEEQSSRVTDAADIGTLQVGADRAK